MERDTCRGQSGYRERGPQGLRGQRGYQPRRCDHTVVPGRSHHVVSSNPDVTLLMHSYGDCIC
jgi:hypothetical protein